MKHGKMLPPKIALVCLCGAVLLSYVMPYRIIPRHFGWTAGGGTAVAGFGIMTWAWALFRRRRTPLRPTETPTAMVFDGPYRFTRNPMYLGIVLMLLGVAVGLGTIVAFLAPLVFLVVMDHVFIPYEEQMLQNAFGQDYLNYMRRVRRWL